MEGVLSFWNRFTQLLKRYHGRPPTPPSPKTNPLSKIPTSNRKIRCFFHILTLFCKNLLFLGRIFFIIESKVRIVVCPF